jgi:DNA-binding CsgD family transcriptional regulator
MDSDVIQPPDFAGQVLTGLIASNVGFAILDRRFRYRSINNALAVIHRVPVQDHFGESIRKMAGEVALTVEPALDAVFETGKVISSFEIVGSLPSRPGLGHWLDTCFPIRDARGRVKQAGVLVVEIGSPVQSKDVVERLSLSTKLVNQLLRQHGEHGILRADAHRIVDGIGKAANKARRSVQEHGSALSEREREVVRLLANGRSNKEIAATLDISVKTVESYRARVFLKLRLESFAGLVRYAIRAGIAEP